MELVRIGGAKGKGGAWCSALSLRTVGGAA